MSLRSSSAHLAILIVSAIGTSVCAEGNPYVDILSDVPHRTTSSGQQPFNPFGSNSAHVDPAADPIPTAIRPLPAITNVHWQDQPSTQSQPIDFDAVSAGDPSRFEGNFSNVPARNQIGTDFYSPPDFEGGLVIVGRDAALKIGGYVKADFIYDFDPIDNTDAFVVTSIPVGAPPRTNARFHARQTRISFDTRWAVDDRVARVYVEGDFFGVDSDFRLRHAYGEIGPWLVGQTWTTFTDVSAAPPTIDFEGSVSNVNRRQAQARWTQPIFNESLILALAVEDTRFIFATPVGVSAEPRTPSPDFVGRVRMERDWGSVQIAGLYRVVGGQPTGVSALILGDDVNTANAWGLNLAGVYLITMSTKVYSQILFGEGIGSYRDLPDAAPTSIDERRLLPLFGWMVGLTREWTDYLSSNFTYAENSLDNTMFQSPDAVSETTYLAANLIWNPVERVYVGIEYLYGIRENVNGATGAAHRAQFAVAVALP